MSRQFRYATATDPPAAIFSLAPRIGALTHPRRRPCPQILDLQYPLILK